MTDYGNSYFNALKKYVRLQKEFDAYKQKMRMKMLFMVALLTTGCILGLTLFLINLIRG